MKSGSGPSDPFADEDEPETENTLTTDSEETSTRDGLPWIYSRESVQDGRVKTVQLHLQSDAASDDRELRAELQQQTTQDLKKADFREAVFMAGLEQLDDAIDTLEEWGYDFEE